eukprot:11207904-Ditylum_brightwellii.AAC.1
MTVTAIKTANDTTIATSLLQGAQANLGFLTTATGVKHHFLLYHYLEEFGSLILNQQRGHYALFGFRDSAQPVTVNTSVLFDVADKHVPGLAYLQDLDTADNINTDPPTTGPNTIPRTEEVLHSTILLPPWITKAMDKAEASSFTKIYLVVCEKAHDQDCLVDANTDDANAPPSTVHREDVLHILQSLWYWNWAADAPQGSMPPRTIGGCPCLVQRHPQQ